MDDDKITLDTEEEEDFLEDDEEGFEEEEYEVERRKGGVIFIVLTICFFLTTGLAGYIYWQEKEINTSNAEKVELAISAKDSMQRQLDTILVKIDSFQTALNQKDSELTELRDESSSLRSEISRLRRIKSGGSSKYKRKIAELEIKLKEYEAKIPAMDSLNKKLMAQNAEIKDQVEKQKMESFELSAKYDKLSERAEQAAVLKALNIVVSNLDKKGRDTEKAKKVKNIKVKATIGANPLIDPGSVELYLRLMKSSKVLSSSPDNLFNVDGTDVLYTDNNTLDYVGEDENVSFRYSNKTDLKPGSYTAEIYAGDTKIGSQRFRLQ